MGMLLSPRTRQRQLPSSQTSRPRPSCTGHRTRVGHLKSPAAQALCPSRNCAAPFSPAACLPAGSGISRHKHTMARHRQQTLRICDGWQLAGTRTPWAMPCPKDGVLAMRWASPEMGDGVPSNPSQSRRPHLSGRQVIFWRRGRACGSSHGLGRVEMKMKMLSPLTRLEKKRPRSIRTGHIQIIISMDRVT